MISTTGKQKPQPSAASHNLFKLSPNPARWSGSSCRRERLSNQVVVFRSPADPPQCPECCANPRLLCRGTNGSNPSPSSKESSNFRFLSGGRIAREQRVEIRRVARDAMIVAVRVGRAAVVGAAPLPLPDAPSKEGSAGSIALPTACRASRQRDRAVRLPDRVIPESIPKRRRRARSRWDRRLPLRPEQHADQLGTLIGDAAGRRPKLCFHSRPISQELQRLAASAPALARLSHKPS